MPHVSRPLQTGEAIWKSRWSVWYNKEGVQFEKADDKSDAIKRDMHIPWIHPFAERKRCKVDQPDEQENQDQQVYILIVQSRSLLGKHVKRAA